MKYLRMKLFGALLRPFSHASRKNRMLRFNKMLQLKDGEKILDLGGHPDIWKFVDVRLDITILNLPESQITLPETSIHKFSLVEGDGCDVSQFEEFSFDIVFSNSVIEHVGPSENQKKFAREVRRLADRYWVQTPSIWFPIEAHTGMPFWFLLPSFVRTYFVKGWEKKLPAWTEMVTGTRVISKHSMMKLFPDAKLLIERRYFVPKSIIAVKL